MELKISSEFERGIHGAIVQILNNLLRVCL